MSYLDQSTYADVEQEARSHWQGERPDADRDYDAAQDEAPERWLPIPGFEGFYEVSDHGRVRSLPRPTSRGGVLHPCVSSPGYPSVRLRKDGKGFSRRTHALVLLAFVGPRPEGLVTRHLDGNPLNNHLENLVYGTGRQNNLDAVAHGTNVNASKTHCPHGHEYTPENTFANRVTGRMCRACDKARKARKAARKTQAARAAAPLSIDPPF